MVESRTIPPSPPPDLVRWVWNRARAVCRTSRVDPADLAQDVLLWWWTKGRFVVEDPRGPLGLVATRIIHRHLDLLRKLQRDPLVSVDPFEAGDGEDQAGVLDLHAYRRQRERPVDDQQVAAVELRRVLDKRAEVFAELSAVDQEVLQVFAALERGGRAADHSAGAAAVTARLGLDPPMTASVFQQRASKAAAEWDRRLGKWEQVADERHEARLVKQQSAAAVRTVPKLPEASRQALRAEAMQVTGRWDDAALGAWLGPTTPGAWREQVADAWGMLLDAEQKRRDGFHEFLDRRAVLDRVAERYARGFGPKEE